MRTFLFYSALALSIATSTLLAFNPPQDSSHGVTMTIADFDEIETAPDKWSVVEIDPAQPLNFKIIVNNTSQHTIKAPVEVWLNDDWEVRRITPTHVTLNPGQQTEINCQATALPGTFAALYPIHARLRFKSGSNDVELHPIAIFKSTSRIELPTAADPQLTQLKLAPGSTRLDGTAAKQIFVKQGDKIRDLGKNFQGTDRASGASFRQESITRGGMARHSFSLHPPYAGGVGVLWCDFNLALPADQTATLTFATAIRDHTAKEPASDGTEHKVFVIDSQQQKNEIFSRFSDSKTWLPAEVDLTPWAGTDVTLRLWTGPGPANDSACDHCYWADPMVTIGKKPGTIPIPTRQLWQEREKTALNLAQNALTTKPRLADGTFRLKLGDKLFGAAVVTGPQGLTDGVIAFTDGDKQLLYRGFECEVNRMSIGGVQGALPVNEVKLSADRNAFIITHFISVMSSDGASQNVPLRVRIWGEKSALAIAWDMPGIERCNRGLPRYTRLGIGPGSEPVWRSYAGLGNVVQNPESFTLNGGGFTLSTRHVGADYPSGISLLQASDIYPDRLNYDKEKQRFALETCHDARFYLIPSTQGAFAAARAFRDISGYRKGPGVDRLLGRICLDQWSGDYDRAARDMTNLGEYGVNDAVFVKHSWQRWGYDYRLPEIYPPRGGLDAMLNMRQATADAGMLFCPHDNYIDIYPDFADYSYNLISFFENGNPKPAWLNEGRRAQSYQWMPHAFHPWMEQNMRLMRDGFSPDSLFIDVFTAIAPFDYYDRQGNFYPKTRTAQEWADAFDTCRKILKRGAPMISEAGTDALIGSVDAAQSDHFAATRLYNEFELADRTPWHDMATHGRMILLAGGLGHRYSATDWRAHNRPIHGYGSDDYLSNTVLGGRNPMCEGFFSRMTIMTYWLLHDVCDVLARSEFESHEFGDSIRQQHTTFSKGSKVWANRGSNTVWQVADGKLLPRYGFYVETPKATAGVYLIDDQRAAFASSPGTLFADARPPFHGNRALKLASSVSKVRHLGKGEFDVNFDWEIFEPIEEGYRPFIHLCHDEAKSGEKIAFQSNMIFDYKLLKQPGAFTATAKIRIPPNTPDGDYAIRYGLYNPDGSGSRIAIRGNNASANRIKGGILRVKRDNNTFVEASHHLEEPGATYQFELNTAYKMLDFGPLTTDGAFRLIHNNRKSWTLIPLPGGYKFRATLKLAELTKKPGKVKRITKVNPLVATAQDPSYTQHNTELSLQCDSQSFAYQIEFE